MKKWVFLYRVAPPINETIQVRFGASVMFAMYSGRQWYMVAGNYLEKIEEPLMWYCDEAWAKEHQRTFPVTKGESSGAVAGTAHKPGISIRRSKKPVQLCFF